MIDKKKIVNFVKYYLIFITIWIFLSSFFDLILFSIASFCFIFFYYFSYRIKLFSKSNEFISFAFIKYLAKLLYSVFQSSKTCVNIIFDEKNFDRSGIKKINVSSLNQEERVLFSNMITMTPGTFVISINNDDYYIHSIDGKSFDTLNADKIKEVILRTRKKNLSDA